jgi:DNA repair photolyase
MVGRHHSQGGWRASGQLVKVAPIERMFYPRGSMRWNNLLLSEAHRPDGMSTPLFEQGAVARTFDTPGFRGITFYEIQAKSIINRVPEASYVPFRWTINPYRGCSHACFYCFARNTHNYLDLDSGEDFNSKIVVKVNAAEKLRVELARRTWRGEHIAMGTNVDPYQRAEGRYQLMRGILEALRDFANPFSILTKGSLILRDLDLLGEASERTDVGTNVSVGFVDRDLWRSLEPGTPSPQKRLEVCQKLNAAGVPCGVLMAPIIPYLTDSPAALEAGVKAIAESGATHVSPIVLHLRTGARGWFMQWLGEHHPDLVSKYDRLYARGSYAPKAYQQGIYVQVQDFAERFGVGKASPTNTRRIRQAVAESAGRMKNGSVEQLSLL